MTVNSSPPIDRRTRRRQLAIDEILHAARAQMRRDGAGALNLNAVARSVGLRTPSLYEYFPGGKHELLDTIFRIGISHLNTMMAEISDDEEPGTALYRVLATYLRFAVETPELYQICYERPVPDFVPSVESLRQSEQLLQRGRSLAERLLARAPNPSFLTVDHLQNLILATMHGIAALHVANEPHLPPGEGRFGSLVPAAHEMMARALGLDMQRPA